LQDFLAEVIDSQVSTTFWLAGYQISRSATAAEDCEIFEFRAEVFRNSGFISAEFRGGLRDEFDESAIQIAARDRNQKLVGAARFVCDSTVGFHTESVFKFDFPSVLRERVCEFGRLVVRRDHRGGERRVMIALLRAVFDCMQESSTTHVLAFLAPGLAQSVARLGLKCLALNVEDATPEIVSRRSVMKPYFDQHHPIPVLFSLHEMLHSIGARGLPEMELVKIDTPLNAPLS